MKFNVSFTSTTHAVCRLGIISDITSLGDSIIRTPLCLLYTKNGAVPHLTHEVLKEVSPHYFSYLLPLPYLASNQDAITEYKKGIKAFVGIDRGLGYVSVQDSIQLISKDLSDKNHISLYTFHGRMKVNTDKFMEIQEAFNPDCFQAMADTDATYSSSAKRIKKSIERTLSFLDICLDKHSKSSKLRDKAVFGTVVGGHDIKSRIISATETASRPVSGFVIHGLLSTSDTQDAIFEDIKCPLDVTLKELPDNKPRLLHGALRPDFVLDAVLSGVDIFDSSYASVATDRGGALDFNSSPLIFSHHSSEVKEMKSFPGEINLYNPKFRDDFGPLVDDCKCYSCRTFTRSYVHHLLKTSELLALTLLAIHNLEYYLNFFEDMRLAIENGTEKEFAMKLKKIFKML